MIAGTREIRSLTGLRGVAAVYVMLYHFSLGRLTGIPKSVMQHGYLSVDLFFVLSGFVMVLTYGTRFRSLPDLSSYLAFLQKRFARVYPLYLFAVLATAAAIWAHLFQGAWPTPLLLAENLLLLQSVGLAASICPPSWSICTEFVAYFFFPLVVGAVAFGSRSRSWLTMLSALGVVVVLANLPSALLHQIQPGTRHGPLDIYYPGTLYPLLRCVAEFASGMVAFSCFKNNISRLRAWGMLTDLLVLLIVCLLLRPGADVWVVGLYPALVFLLSKEQGIAVRVLSSRFSHWLGLVSYSIYLNHFLIHGLLGERIKDVLASLHVPAAMYVSGGCLVAVTLVMAASTYYTIERPARNWLRRTTVAGPPTKDEGACEREPSAP